MRNKWKLSNGNVIRFDGTDSFYRSGDVWFLPAPCPDSYSMMFRGWRPTIGLDPYIDALWVEYRRATRGVIVYDELVPWR